MSPQCPATLNPEKKAISGVRRSERALTMNVYVKGVSEAQVSAMDALSEKLVLCNVRGTPWGKAAILKNATR